MKILEHCATDFNVKCLIFTVHNVSADEPGLCSDCADFLQVIALCLDDAYVLPKYRREVKHRQLLSRIRSKIGDSSLLRKEVYNANSDGTAAEGQSNESIYALFFHTEQAKNANLKLGRAKSVFADVLRTQSNGFCAQNNAESEPLKACDFDHLLSLETLAARKDHAEKSLWYKDGDTPEVRVFISFTHIHSSRISLFLSLSLSLTSSLSRCLFFSPFFLFVSCIFDW